MNRNLLTRGGVVLTVATLLTACSSSSSNNATDNTDNGEGDEAGNTSCTENLSVDLAVIPSALPSVAITPDGSKIFLAWMTGSGAAKNLMIAIYGSDGTALVAPKVLIKTAGSNVSVAASSSGLAIAWDDDVSPMPGVGAYPVSFFTALGFDGTPANQPSSNDSTGLSGATDYVSASAPQVVATSSGYVVAWNDTRTLYPPVEGENLADADGIYARHFGQNGTSTDSNDVQVMQNGHDLWSLTGGATPAVLWQAYGDNGNPADGTLQLATTLGASTPPITLGTLGIGGDFSLIDAQDGSFPVSLTGNLGTNPTDSATGLVLADSSGKPSQLTVIDESTSPHSNAQAFSQNDALSVVWVEGLPTTPASIDSPIQLRAASYAAAVNHVRSVGPTANASQVRLGSAAVVGSTAYVPIVAVTQDKQAHLDLATVCSGS